MVGEFSKDFKSSNRIEISWLVQVLLNFYWFQGPRGGGGWGWGWVLGMCVGVPWMYACAHMHTHMHMHVKHDKHGCLHVSSHLQFLYMYTCACMHVGTPPMPSDAPDTPHPPAHPQSHRESKTPKFNKSWTNRDNSILFEDFFTSEHSWTHIDYSCSPQIPLPTCPTPPKLRKPKSEKLQ